MYLHQVTLNNNRGFAELAFDFQRPDGTYAGWTVFTGDNGSGKSTLLKAIAIGLTGRDVARSLQPTFHRWIREGAQPAEAVIQLEIAPVAADDSVVESGKRPGGRFPARLLLQNGCKEPSLHGDLPPGKPRNYS